MCFDYGLADGQPQSGALLLPALRLHLLEALKYSLTSILRYAAAMILHRDGGNLIISTTTK